MQKYLLPLQLFVGIGLLVDQERTQARIEAEEKEHGQQKLLQTASQRSSGFCDSIVLYRSVIGQ